MQTKLTWFALALMIGSTTLACAEDTSDDDGSSEEADDSEELAGVSQDELTGQKCSSLPRTVPNCIANGKQTSRGSNCCSLNAAWSGGAPNKGVLQCVPTRSASMGCPQPKVQLPAPKPAPTKSPATPTKPPATPTKPPTTPTKSPTKSGCTSKGYVTVASQCCNNARYNGSGTFECY